ncbi:MAG: dehydrogenase, partial [Planctomycetaceae bacterium]
DFHPTDVLEDADGSLLIVDTGGWYKLCCPTSQLAKPDVLGAIYRVRRADALKRDDPRGLKIDWSLVKVYLPEDDRPAVRQRAIREISQRYNREQNNADVGLQRQLAGQSVQLRLDAVWTLTRMRGDEPRSILSKLLRDRQESVRQAALHAVSLGRWNDDWINHQLRELLDRGTQRDRRLAAEAIGRIGKEDAIAPLLGAASLVGDDRFLEHSIIYALIEIAQPGTTRAGLSASNPLTIKAALIALDQMPNGGLKPEEVAKHLTSPEPLLRETAAWIISRHADWGEALAGYLRERLAAPLTRSVSEGERSTGLTDAEQKTLGQQLAQFAKAASVQELLAATVRDTKLPTSARLTALGAMQDSKLKELPRSWSAALLNVLGEDDLTLISLAVNTARVTVPAKEDAAAWRKPLLAMQSRLGLRPDPIDDKPLKTVGTESQPTMIRLAALAALPGGLAANEADDKLFDFLLSQLAPELSVVQRGTAAEVLSKAKLSKAQLTKLTEQFATTGPLEVDRLLAAFEQSTDEQVGQQLIAALKTAPALTALRPDAIKTRLAKYSPSVQEAAQPLYAALNLDLGKQRQQLEEMLASLPPGDIVRGQKVFHNEKAACKACHALGYLGGKTGPDLTRIGGIRNERDLLESILFPSASFVRSFEPVLIVTTNGKTVNGLIRSETPDELVIATGPNKEERVARADIEEMKPSSVSIMPAGLEKQLTKEQLADLIAFLKNCK